MEYIFQMFKGLGIVVIIGVVSIFIYCRAKKETNRKDD